MHGTSIFFFTLFHVTVKSSTLGKVGEEVSVDCVVYKGLPYGEEVAIQGHFDGLF